jgi:hypothetical protein
MGPLEVFFITIAIIFALIGLARGYKRELGSTFVILIMIFVLSFFEEQLLEALSRVGGLVPAICSPNCDTDNLLIVLTFQVIFIVVVFASYAGLATIEFQGSPAPPPQGSLLSLAIGALNGYLVAGTLWYYLDKYGYPGQSLGLVRLPLTPSGQTIVEYLPQRIFESPAYWMLPVAVLLYMLIRG